jgi:hypothetical protein
MRCHPALLYRRSKRQPLPSSKRVIAPTQRRRRPPVLDWASFASPRADKQARIRTECLPNSPTSASAARALPRSPAHWTSTERSKSACMPTVKKLLEQRPRWQRHTSHPDRTPMPRRRPMTNARPQLLQRQMQRLPELSPAMGPSHPRRNDGATRRADSCSPSSNYMRHRVRLRWREWKHIGASGQVVNWIRHGVRVKL